MSHAVHEVVQSRLPEIADLCRQFQVERLDVFGSAARGEDFEPSRSDVDLLVRFAPGAGRLHLALWRALQKLLGRHVDLILDGSIRNPYLLRTVEEDRRTIYEA